MGLKAAFLGTVCAFAIVTSAFAQAKSIDIPAGDLKSGLDAYIQQSGAQLIYKVDQVRGLTTHGAHGNLTPDAALHELLQGTRLVVHQDESGALVVSAEVRSKNVQAASDEGAAGGDVETVVVTGTHLHNVEPLSDLTTFTHQDFLNQGYTRLDQMVANLPQNNGAGAVADSSPTTGIGNGSSFNNSRASGVNLYGLGASSTLVLLNGQRLALSNFGSSVDISLIPVSIIDRVEILTDGASAIYGADAVGGVVNIITRSDYSGFQVGARMTGISDGKAPNYGANALGGFDWDTGNLVLSYDFEKDNPLYARNRRETQSLGNPTSLLPDQQTNNLFGSLRQELAPGLEISANAMYSRRAYTALSFYAPTSHFSNTHGASDQFFTTAELSYAFGDWHASLDGHYAKENGTTNFFDTFATPPNDTSAQLLTNKESGVEAHLDGPLFSLPGGDARAAIGGAYRSESLKNDIEDYTPTASSTINTSSRAVTSAFGELLIPIVGEANSVTLIKSLQVDISARYDHYTDFGSAFVPKYAVQWQPADDLSLHASYGRSFRAPTLYENTPGAQFGAYIFDAPDPLAPSGSSIVLDYFNPTPNLQPEKARTVEAGASWSPSSVPELTLDVSYFDINFRNRIEELSQLGYFLNVLTQQSQLGSLVTRNPSVAQVNAILNEPGQQVFSFVGPFTPSDIKAIANIGYVNAAISNPQGFNFKAHYGWNMDTIGHLALDGSAIYYTSYKQELAPGAASYQAINLPYLPTRFKGNIGVRWDNQGWGAYTRVNYTSGYHNPDDPACSGPKGCPVSAYTTVNVGLSYTFNDGDSEMLSGTRLAVDVSDLFNASAPYVYNFNSSGQVNYDPTNASIVGRTVSLSLIKDF